MICDHNQPKVWYPAEGVTWCEACGALRLSYGTWLTPELWSPTGKPFMTTVSGRIVQLLAPSSLDVAVDDIAHHLAMLVRFCGAIREFYSVGEHSINVAVCVYRRLGGVGDPRTSGFVMPDDPEINPRLFWGAILRGLFHDGTEAYLCDCIGPLKHLLPLYREIERRHTAAVFEHLGFWPTEDWDWADELVHAMDGHAFAVEDHVLRGARKHEDEDVQFVYAEDWKMTKAKFIELAAPVIEQFRMAG